MSEYQFYEFQAMARERGAHALEQGAEESATVDPLAIDGEPADPQASRVEEVAHPSPRSHSCAQAR